MRIALITTDNRENDRRYDVPAPYFGTAPAGLLQGFEMLQAPGTEVHVISCTQRPVGAPEKLSDGIFFHSLLVPKIGWLRTGYSLCIAAVRKKLAEIQPDIIHAQGTERECAISASLAPYPRVLTIHGNMRLIARFFRAKPWSALGLHAMIERFSVPRFDGVICISSYTRQAVETLAKQTWIVPNAADRTFYGIPRDPADPPEILCVAMIDPRKNQNAFIDAVMPLAAEKNFRLRFFGAGNPDSPFMREFLARMERHSTWCSFEGMIGRDDLRAKFQRATALVLPSHEDNCPMTILEAMASGVPVLASRVGGIPDLVQHEATGLLCDPNSPESMREGLSRILSDKALRDKLIASALVHAAEVFHPRAVAARHLEIYREVLASK